MPRLSLAKLERHLYSAADRLRQEGLDAATYKDYIFGLLFLKRCSDVFDAEREKIVGKKVDQGGVAEEVEQTYGEDPDYYDGFFVHPRARWSFLVQKLNDASEPYGAVLDKALGALSEENESLEHVLDHISFMRTQGNKRVLSDEACKDLVRQFSRQRLRNEDFQFSDLLGAAYEFLINMFAESAGKKGGDFYTPRDVIRLMARMLKPQAGMSVYDPTCGSGGMLIISREYVEQSGGDPTDLRLCGQVNDASAWSICRLNMLLHGVRGADIRLQDTLLHPMHRDGEALERFSRVIANPPFSQNYTRASMEFPERFHWGWCPTTGKKGDLMFAQHMLHVCKPDGIVATVMPHGVLFRGGEEKKIRKKFLEQDLVEAVIGLPPNLFYGAGIPACILVMRPNLRPHLRNSGKPEGRRGKVLFINADAEFHAGRAQNYLRPEHIEKIASTFDRFETVSGYARVVEVAEISDPLNDWNLNIRRYVDNAPPPEPHDVRAHLHGGVPVSEVDALSHFWHNYAGLRESCFTVRPEPVEGPATRYADFTPALQDKRAIADFVKHHPGVTERHAQFMGELQAWWQQHLPVVQALAPDANAHAGNQHATRRNVYAVRATLLKSIERVFSGIESDGSPYQNLLTRYQIRGAFANYFKLLASDFKSVAASGWGPELIPDEDILQSQFPQVLAELETQNARLAELQALFAAASEEEFEDSEDTGVLPADQVKALKAELKEAKGLAKLAKRDASLGNAQALTHTADRLEAQLARHKTLEEEARTLKALVKTTERKKTELVEQARLKISGDEARHTIIDRLGRVLLESYQQYLQADLRACVAGVENLWGKYAVTAKQIEAERDEAAQTLQRFLVELGYE